MTYSIAFFDTWQPGYGGVEVKILKAGTNDLADVFTDFGLTQRASNPQTLQSLNFGGVCYGMWSAPLYTAQAVKLDIGGQHDTGVLRPSLTALNGVDASSATVIASGTTRVLTLASIAAFDIRPEQDGTLGPSASANDTVLTSTIGRAAAAGGGVVCLPAGTILFNSLSLPKNVILRGAGDGVTSLQSQDTGNVITLADDGAGLMDLTLDGVNLPVGSVGVYGVGIEGAVFARVTVKRFDTGVHFKGHKYGLWFGLTVSACNVGMKAHGDTDAGDTALGTEFSYNRWSGGGVELNIVTGIDLSYEDAKVQHNQFERHKVDSNVADYAQIRGAQQTVFDQIDSFGNGTHFDVADDDLTTVGDDNKTIGLRVRNSRLNGGTMVFTGRCQDVVFEADQIEDVDIALTNPENMILFLDTLEDSLVTLAGQGTQLGRMRSTERAKILGQTTDAVATKAFAVTIEPGELVYCEVIAIAREQNGTDRAIYHESAGASRPGSTLGYDAQTVNFTVGEVLTGAISGATAIIQVDSDSGGFGTLTLIEIQPGPTGDLFLNDELITDALGGSADADGTLAEQNAVLDMAQASVRAQYESTAGLAVTIAVTAGDIQVDVTGLASSTIDWQVDVNVVKS